MKERQVDRLESIGKMSSMYLAMKDANESYDKDLKSQSGLSGGDGEKMMEEVRKMQNLTGEFVGTVKANAPASKICFVLPPRMYVIAVAAIQEAEPISA